jgi:hypothetical protein
MRVYTRVFSTFIVWSNENKSCMRVDKREFAWEFSQLLLLDQTRTRVAWELTSEFTWEFSQLSLLDQTRTRVVWVLTSKSLHESFLNFHCLIKREQELHESWQARVCSTFIAWSNANKSCMRVDKREFAWEFSQLSLLDKREQELHESWQVRVYMKVFSTFIAWSNENKSLHESWQARVYMRVFSTFIAYQTRTRVVWVLTSKGLHESCLNFHCLIKREQ